MPDNSAWTTGLSNTNGWADMFTAYGGSGVPRNASPGCATGTVMSCLLYTSDAADES